MSTSLHSKIPLEVLLKIKNKAVVETSFATGPGFCAGKVETHKPPITVEQGLAWLERYRDDLKGACIVLDDESRLMFSWGKFDRYLAKPKTSRPAPGISMADLTDPRTLEAIGLRREGNKLVSDDAEAVVIGEFDEEEMAAIEKQELKKKRGKTKTKRGLPD